MGKNLSTERISKSYQRLLQIDPIDNGLVLDATGSNAPNLTFVNGITRATMSIASDTTFVPEDSGKIISGSQIKKQTYGTLLFCLSKKRGSSKIKRSGVSMLADWRVCLHRKCRFSIGFVRFLVSEAPGILQSIHFRQRL